MNFKDIIGHEKIINALKKTIENKTINHSYLFEGDESIGKSKVAYAFAKTLLCRDVGHEPCNNCISCNKFDSGNHPDFFVIEPENGIIKVPQIEAMIKETRTLPLESNRKVFIIDDSHKMNVQSNIKLLKTLEEPPDYVNFILISSSSNNLLSTILSRVQSIKFSTIEYSKIIDLLVNKYDKPQEEARLIAEFSKGAIGKSVRIAEDDSFFQRIDEIINIIESLLNGDKTKVFSAMDFFNENKEIIDEILDIFLLWFRDLLLFKEIGQSELLINKDKIERLSLQSKVNSNKINDIIIRVQETKFNIRRNVNYQLAIETMLLNIGGI
ncbi:MAG: DNA polymerase III subunit delta' [Tissierellaceae bacterium]|nr:DNA polymerase III subunit delta' [Tissierellaceae bacterium]